MRLNKYILSINIPICCFIQHAKERLKIIVHFFFLILFVNSDKNCLNGKYQTQYYRFQFIRHDIEMPTDTDYENDDNWSDEIPMSPPCFGSDIPCEIIVLKSSINNLPGSTTKQKFLFYLNQSTFSSTSFVLLHTVANQEYIEN